MKAARSLGNEASARAARAIPTKAARHHQITELLRHHAVRSQGELGELLAAHGVPATQATLSRDLVELGAIKVRHPSGGLVYVVPGDGGDRTPWGAVDREVLDARLARICAEVLVSAEASANLVVLRTPPGAAQFLASAIDISDLDEVLGTIAGDDTVMVITKRPQGGSGVAAIFTEMSRGARAD